MSGLLGIGAALFVLGIIGCILAAIVGVFTPFTGFSYFMLFVAVCIAALGEILAFFGFILRHI